MKRHIPNFITSLNLASGFIAILFAAGGNIVTASWFILAAMIFDFTDGFSARLLKSYSAMGKELDSLADVVSFGIAPALIIYHLIAKSILVNPQADFGTYNLREGAILLLTVIMPVCAALRLAKFNIDETQAMTFKGLPTPANALAVISIPIAIHYSPNSVINGIAGSAMTLAILTVALSLLMVTRLPLLSMKTSHLKFRGNEGRYALLIMIVAVFIFLGYAAFPLIIPLYIIASLISLAFR
jgi:CDP-diacylglycerol--serine O-phosphatidyltransferase